eukprot:NODE_45_length_32908_cov_0.790271.p11 type:complete len:329 gc:universal NODE_45_length_32908_cov_0.790271:28987-28001(-)
MRYQYFPTSEIKENSPKTGIFIKYRIYLVFLLIVFFSWITFYNPFTKSNLKITPSKLIEKQPTIENTQANTPIQNESKIQLPLVPTKPHYNMIFVVPADINAFKSRMAVRTTWKSKIPSDSKLIFFFGKSGFTPEQLQAAKMEQEQYQDIVLLDMMDSYKNLTTKMTHIYEYVSDHFTANWLFKTDTDVWIDMKRLFQLFANHQPKTVIGTIAVNFKVQKSGQFENLVYSNTRYPNFPIGCGFGMSFDIVQYISKQSKMKWLKMMPNEDAALGIWLSSTNVKLLHSNDINDSHRCKPTDLLSHHVKPDIMYLKQKNFEKCGNHCGCDS